MLAMHVVYHLDGHYIRLSNHLGNGKEVYEYLNHVGYQFLVSLGDSVKVKKISRMLYKATTADTIRGKVEEEGTFNICEFSCLFG